MLDAAGAMGDKMHANELRLYLIAFLSICTGALVFIMYMVLFTVPLCCQTKVDANEIKVKHKQDVQDKYKDENVERKKR